MSTLFLLELGNNPSSSGRTLSPLRSSLSMWLQICAVVVLAILMSEPRLRALSRAQRIVIVLDDSFSMRAFTSEALSAISRTARLLEASAETTEWSAVLSNPTATEIYDGRSSVELLSAIERWIPSSPGHDPAPAIDRARRTRGLTGRIIFVTDHPMDVASDVTILGVGSPIANIGIAGSSIGSPTAEGERLVSVLVRNYSDREATRRWWLEAGGRASPEQSVSIEPRGIASIRVAMPAGARGATFRLNADGFALDDALPLLVDRPKELRLAIAGDFPDPDLARRIIGSLPASREAKQDDSHIVFTTAALDGAASIVAPPPAGSSGPRNRRIESVSAPRGSIAHGLRWDGLIAASLGERHSGSTILWQGSAPLVSLSGTGSNASLYLDFDLGTSNAGKLPAFVLLLSRFAESVRGALPLYEERSFDLAQPISAAFDRDIEIEHHDALTGERSRRAVSGREAAFVRAPATPGFFVIRAGKSELLRGASVFADSREADLSSASASEPSLPTRPATSVRTERDGLRSLWLLLLAALCAGSWLADRAPKLEGGSVT